MPSTAPRTGRQTEDIPTILVVEDEVLIRLMISEYLREFGYRVVEAGTGVEARRVLQSSQPVDVVFSDIRMPGDMSGLALAEWVGRNKPEVSVVLTSDHLQAKDLPAQAAADASFVEKPYAPLTVLKSIRAQLYGAH